MITRMPPYNIFEELPKIANQVREISEDLGAELDFAVAAMQTAFDLAIQKASTARTDGWVSVEERLPEDSELVLLFQRDGIASMTTFGVRDKGKWLDYNNTTDDYPNEIRKITHWQPLPAAPGSVPQAPVAANTRCSEHKVFHPACADCWKEYYKSPAFCVPQAEPPKEEKL